MADRARCRFSSRLSASSAWHPRAGPAHKAVEAAMERGQSRPAGAASAPLLGHAAWLEMTAALDWLPLAALVLTPDGTALAANEAWAKLSGAPAEAARGDGWLRAVAPLDRGPLRALLREAPPGETGCGDFRLAGPVGKRWSRWRWLPGPDPQA